MYSAVSEHKLHFNYVHEKDGSPIGYQKVCKAEDKQVPEEEIVKGFEWSDGEFVIMRDEDFEAAQERSSRTIDIRDFVKYEEIDPIYFDRTYYLGPAENAEKVYSLLARAMSESELAGIAKYVMRDRQNLGCLRVREGAIMLERMHFADEVRPPDEAAPDGARVGKDELQMARRLIDEMAGPFEPEKYDDTYRDTLCEIIKRKREGETIRAPEAPEEPEAPDLMAALKASLGRAGGNGRAKDGDLSRLSKDELYKMAQEADVPGRADMTKDELAAALKR
jgi:DNA end-binding protein Ku